MKDLVQPTQNPDETPCVHPVASETPGQIVNRVQSAHIVKFGLFKANDAAADAVIELCASEVSALAENTQELKLCMGEISAQELRTLRSGLRLAAHKIGLLKVSPWRPDEKRSADE